MRTLMIDRRHFLTTAAAAMALPVQAGAGGPLSVVATTGMIADAVRVIGGPDVALTALMGPGIDPHSYRQTRSDIVALSRADVVLWNGLYLEAQMEGLLLDLARRKPVVAVGEAVPQDQLISHADYAGRFDPHVWMVPELWSQVVTRVQQAMSDARPDLSAIFAERTETYLADIDAVGVYARDVLSRVPVPARVLVTAHDAFGYFGRAYGYEVLGVQGISTESEAGLDRIRSLTNTLVARGIGAVFVESSVTDRNLRALIEGAAAQGHTVQIGGELFSDAMGQPGSYEATYVGMVDHNATVIAAALGATVPDRGLNGQLSAGF